MPKTLTVMKHLVPFFLLLTITSFSHAQWMTSSITISTPYGNRTITTMSYIPVPRFSGAGFGFKRKEGTYYNDVKNERSEPFNFTVALNRSDSVFTQKIRIELSKDGNFLVFKHQGEQVKLFPASTKFIAIAKPRETIIGIPVDSCWLFKTNAGRINTYASVPYGVNTIAVQLGDEGPIYPLTKAAIKEFVGVDKELLALVERGKLLAAIRRYNKIKKS